MAKPEKLYDPNGEMNKPDLRSFIWFIDFRSLCNSTPLKNVFKMKPVFCRMSILGIYPYLL